MTNMMSIILKSKRIPYHKPRCFAHAQHDKKLWQSLAVVFLLLAIPALVLAGGADTTGCQFLKVGPTARGMGFAGAYSAICDDASSVYWNPAGLASLDMREVSATYLKYWQGIYYGFVATAIPLKDTGVFGVGITYLGVDDIEARVADTLKEDRKFGAYDASVRFSFARENAFPKLLDDLSVGVGVQFIQQKLDDEQAFSGAIDLGIRYPISNNLNLSLGLYNIGIGPKFIEERDPMPLDIRGGIACKPFGELLTISADGDAYILDQRYYGSLGAEVKPIKYLALRAGYRFGYGSDKYDSSIVGLACGGSIYFAGISLDYAYVPFAFLGETHRITLGVKF